MVAEKEWGLVGIAGALVYPFYFNAGHKTAQELFWWVDTEHRGVGATLFIAMRDEVRKRGAKSLSMIALEAIEPERVGAFYMRHGFRPSERSYIGRL
jgi:GNAT superfamily N-acetyltransferase